PRQRRVHRRGVPRRRGRRDLLRLQHGDPGDGPAGGPGFAHLMEIAAAFVAIVIAWAASIHLYLRHAGLTAVALVAPAAAAGIAAWFAHDRFDDEMAYAVLAGL